MKIQFLTEDFFKNYYKFLLQSKDMIFMPSLIVSTANDDKVTGY